VVAAEYLDAKVWATHEVVAALSGDLAAIERDTHVGHQVVPMRLDGQYGSVEPGDGGAAFGSSAANLDRAPPDEVLDRGEVSGVDGVGVGGPEVLGEVPRERLV
jgi:hypothetical protein